MLLGHLPLTVRCRTVSVQLEGGQCRGVAGRARGQLLASSTAALLDECGLLESVTCQSPEERHVMKTATRGRNGPWLVSVAFHVACDLKRCLAVKIRGCCLCVAPVHFLPCTFLIVVYPGIIVRVRNQIRCPCSVWPHF